MIAKIKQVLGVNNIERRMEHHANKNKELAKEVSKLKVLLDDYRDTISDYHSRIRKLEDKANRPVGRPKKNKKQASKEL